MEIRNRDGYGNYTFWRTAPKMCGDRVAILGELGKYVSMSSQRVTGMVETCGTGELVRVDLVGSPGENVRISFAVFRRRWWSHRHDQCRGSREAVGPEGGQGYVRGEMGLASLRARRGVCVCLGVFR